MVLSALLVVALLGWFTFDFLSDRLRAPRCTSSTSITVTAAPDIAPTVTRLGREVSEEDTEGCYQVRVIDRESAATSESLTVSDGTERPDVWIPESTLWLQRAQNAGAWDVPVTGTSIATSPVVLAVTEAAASELGWPDRQPSWAQIIGPGSRSAAGSLTVGFADPARDPVGVSTLLGLRELTEDAPNPDTAGTAAMRGLSVNTVEQQSELFARLPSAADPAEALAAFPTSENAVLRHNVKQGAPLVAVYADPAVPALDYPYVVLPETPDAERAAAEKFLDRLLDESSARRLADSGFRTPDGKALRDRSQDRRTSATPMTPVALPGAPDVEQLLNAWAGVNLSGRLQVLLDVSGSMDEQVPGTALTRMAVTIQAATAGIGLFKPTTKLGMWLFSTELDGNKDYRVLLPVRPIDEQLAGGALDKLRAVRAQPNGNTALYDTILAAYQDGRRNWEPGRINTLVVLTDGKDDNASGIGRAQLLAQLRELQDTRRPLKLIGIGIGPDVDPAELTAIARATGGQAFIAADPTKIGDVFYAALSLMLCQPPACQPGRNGG